MINLAINRSIMKSSVSASGQAEPAAAEKQTNTFQDILRETIYKSANETSTLYNVNDTFSADTDDEIANYAETEPVEDILYTEPQVKILSEPTIYAEYVEIEINGRWVKQATDEFCARLGYNVEALKANNIDANLLKYIDEYGFVPKFIVPLDMGHTTDYTMTVATSERLAKTAGINAAFDAYSGATQTTVATSNNHINPTIVQKPSEKTNDLATITNTALDSVASKAAVAVDNPISQTSEKSPEKIGNLTKTIVNSVALRILSSLNVLDIWKSQEKEDEQN